jgi:hypothetical protein
MSDHLIHSEQGVNGLGRACPPDTSLLTNSDRIDHKIG